MIRIGTRKSELALWQAKFVQNELKVIGLNSELILIDSYGDAHLKQPLYDLGVVGVFTKSLDIALLNNEIDIAVHSMKDVPVKLPIGITEFAIPKRGVVEDVFIVNQINTNVIATSSLRRKAQWLSRFPDYKIEDLRGNVNTRIQKVKESNWEGAIFAKAGLERIGLLPDNYKTLEWIIPAPAQGALMITGRTEDIELKEQVAVLNDSITSVCVSIERKVLQLLEGGCTAPIAVHVKSDEDSNFLVRAGVYSLDGKEVIEIEKKYSNSSIEDLAEEVYRDLITKGAKEIIAQYKQR